MREFQKALECYHAIINRGAARNVGALEALGYSRGAELLTRIGDIRMFEPTPMEESSRLIDQLQALGNDRARTAGAVDLLLINARARASMERVRGRMLHSIQPRAFARLLSRWASPRMVADGLDVELETVDHLLALGMANEGMRLLVEAEQSARAGGRREVVANALERKSRALARQAKSSAAIAAAREAHAIVYALERRGDAQLLELHIERLSSDVSEQPEHKNAMATDPEPLPGSPAHKTSGWLAS